MKGKQTFRSKVHVLRYLHMLGNGGKICASPHQPGRHTVGKEKRRGKKK